MGPYGPQTGPGPYGSEQSQKNTSRIRLYRCLQGALHPALSYSLDELWAHKGTILFQKLIILIRNYKIINKNIKTVNLEILKVKTWFGDKDL